MNQFWVFGPWSSVPPMALPLKGLPGQCTAAAAAAAATAALRRGTSTEGGLGNGGLRGWSLVSGLQLLVDYNYLITLFVAHMHTV